MSEDTAPIVVTLKAGTGYDAPWLVIRGYDPDDVTNKLKSLDGVIEATLEAAGLFAAQRGLGANSAPAEAAVTSTAPKSGWGSSPAAAQQTQQGGQGSHPNAVLHPEGKQCVECGNVLEQKKSQGGKLKWQCNAWRWNNGSPNNHSMEWAN